MRQLRDLVLKAGGPLVVAVGSLDATPAGVVPAAVADAVAVVAVRNRTHRSDLRRVTETLRLIGSRLAGALMLEPGDRASRLRAAAIRPAEPAEPAAAPIATAMARPKPPARVNTTGRRRRTG
jgi:hypothetical protein